MIYTITFNPAIDYVYYADSIIMGGLNRSVKEEIYFGGKGINVSLVLKELGIASKALGFVAGFTGEAIEKGIKEKGINTDFVHLDSGFSRINVKVKSDEETELNGQGPDISEQAVEELFEKLGAVSDGDMLVLSGSIPKTLPSNMYERILERVKYKAVKVAVDACGELLLNTLKYKPFLVKPNKEELEKTFGTKLENIEDIVDYAKKLQEMGAQNVLVSMADDGAVLVAENGSTYISKACRGEVISSVGAGDSMLAGFIAGLEKGDYEYALKLGTAAGEATAFSGGLARAEKIYEMMSDFVEQK